jgi:hypothetical protein
MAGVDGRMGYICHYATSLFALLTPSASLTESEGRGPPVSRINYFADSRLAREVLT